MINHTNPQHKYVKVISNLDLIYSLHFILMPCPVMSDTAKMIYVMVHLKERYRGLLSDVGASLGLQASLNKGS